jgi:hypothetical protein
MASADGKWTSHLQDYLLQPRAASISQPKMIMWETEERVVEQTFDTHAGKSVHVNAQPGGRQEIVTSDRQSAARLICHAPDGTAPDGKPHMARTGWHAHGTTVLELLESLQTLVEGSVLQPTPARLTEESVVEEAMIGDAGTAGHLDTPLEGAGSPNTMIAVLGEESATQWLISQLRSEWRWLNGKNEVGKDHDIECQLKAPKAEPRSGLRHTRDKRKLHRKVGWIIWLLFVVYVTYIANMRVYILITYGYF